MKSLSLIQHCDGQYYLTREGGWNIVPGWIEVKPHDDRLEVFGPLGLIVGALPLSDLSRLNSAPSVNLVDIIPSGFEIRGSSLVVIEPTISSE